jgi:PAS domain S-box-containing protein
VYVIPPNTTMTIVGRVLQLSPREPANAPHMPVDMFLRSLAEDLGDRAVGVVLSGSASDGALGIKAIKGEGGITFAQDPETARYDGMPRSALASGAVDFVLPPKGIARELARIGGHLARRAPSAAAPEPNDERALDQIYRTLRQESGVDFRHYRQTTIRRRIARRMLVHKIDSIEQYCRYLQANRPEIQNLYSEVLINVTRFFRDVEAFEALQQLMLSRISRHRSADQTLRVWVPGCATGEEAYSLAIALTEALDRADAKLTLQVFGTDVSDAAVARARSGIYPPNIELDVSPERLRRFFTKLDGQYQVKKSLRELCIFARHNLAKDPPFSGVDVISCRNVLIYFDATMQRRIMAAFHYALRNTGLLLLGTSETVGPLSELFTLVDRENKLYAKKPTSTRFMLGLSMIDRRSDERGHVQGLSPRPDEGAARGDLQRDIERILLNRYAPAGVLINDAYDIVQFRGHTSAYLEAAQGHASLNVIKMAREGLLKELRAAILTARKRGVPVRREGVQVKQHGSGVLAVNLEVIPVKGPGEERHYLVLFEDAPTARAPRTAPPARPARRGASVREIERLDQELTATKEFLQSIVEDREAANEELRSANEELQSTNEELQSTNEELETAKEELQSVNEELTTVNEELRHRNTELAQANNDTNNLVASVSIPIIILGHDLRIRRFTPMAGTLFNLLPADVGRPISGIRGNVEVPDLDQVCARVIETGSPATREVPDREGGWHSLRIRPYRTSDNLTDGAVIALIDISAVRNSLEQIAAARDYAEGIVETVRTPLAILDEDYRVRSANRAFYETFQTTMEDTVNRVFFDVGTGQWNLPGLRRALSELVERGTSFDDFEIEHDFPTIGERTVMLSARRIRRDTGPLRAILVAIEDITARRQAEREVRASEEIRYRRLFETAQDGIVLLDADTGQITNANPSWSTVTGREAGTVLGHKLWEIDAFEDAETIQSILLQLQARDFVRYEDLRLVRPDGARRHVELACNVYRLAGKKVVQCFVRDITNRVDLLERERAARTEAEAANRAKDDFLSVLSHELRTPLTAMLGWVRVLRKGALEPSKIADALETVERNTRVLAQLIEDLLDVSRIAAGKLAIEVKRVDLGAVVGAAVETIRESSDANGVALHLDVPERAPTVRGDRHRLQQVVWNLLSNAVKFTPRDGRIDVKLETTPTAARLTVSDTGRGIAPEFLPQIFDRFRQIDSVTTRSHGGLGLGLAIVRHLVELHGGRVGVFSAGEGLGTTFTIDLPQAGASGLPPPTDEDEAGARPGADTGVEVRLDGLRVLVVEDEADTGRMLAQVLGERGAEVIHVETSAAALEALKRDVPHVLLSDIGMPGGDGYGLIRQVRALSAEAGGRVPAVALTAFAREEDMRRAVEAGFDLHLPKPVDPAELARVVAEVARSNR